MKKNKTLFLGIDDAGRGPLLGPMVLTGVLIDEETGKQFKELGVRDSKTLSPKRREFLAKEIKEKVFSFHTTLSFPKDIDSKIKSGVNLNTIEAIHSAEIINKLTKGKKQLIQIVIDCPSPNREKWKDVVLKYTQKKPNILISCEHKADVNHIAVSAASVLAKSTREKEIAKIKKKIGKDFGSGYPNDPKTIEFLSKHKKEHKDDGLFRKSWATFKNSEVKKEQKKLLDF